MPSESPAIQPCCSRTFCSWHRPMAWFTQKSIAVPGVWEGKGISSLTVVCLFQIQGSYSVCRPCWLGMYYIAQASLKLSHFPASATWGLELQAWAAMPVFNDFGLHMSVFVRLWSSKRKWHPLPEITFTCAHWTLSFLFPEKRDIFKVRYDDSQHLGSWGRGVAISLRPAWDTETLSTKQN